MPTKLPGRRPIGKAGALQARERTAIEGWFIEGLSVAEVYAKCIDEGIDPPIEHALYRIRASEPVQQGLRARVAAEAGSRIARIAERTRDRQRLRDGLERVLEERADHYAGFVPGGDSGLVVLTDVKTIRTGPEDYDRVDIHKLDAALIEQWRGLLNDQEKSDEAVRRNMRQKRIQQLGEQRHEQEAQLRLLDITKRQAEVTQIELDAKRNADGTYQPPTFPAVIVERLPDPVRPPELDLGFDEPDESAVPEVPWPLLEQDEQA